MHETLGAWEFDREVGLEVAATTAVEQLQPPDLEVVTISTRGDLVTVQVVDGSLRDPNSVLFLPGRGLFEVLRVERWPPLGGGGEPRVLLALRAWPNA